MRRKAESKIINGGSLRSSFARRTAEGDCPHIGVWKAWRLATTQLLLRRLAVHDCGPFRPIRRHLITEGVQSRRGKLHGEAAFHHCVAHLLVAGPGPGVAVERASRILELAPTV